MSMNNKWKSDILFWINDLYTVSSFSSLKSILIKLGSKL